MAGKAVWCLDVGANSIKALRAHKSGNRIEIDIFDVIEYDKPLDAPEVDPYEQMEKALITFLRRNDAERDRVYVSMSGQSALFRFIPLPPVSKSKVPEIVQYEARQQIPFPLDEVVWGYDTIDRGAKQAEQIEVGLFAMKKELIFQFLAPFRTLGFEIDAIQLVPNALYNFLAFEKPLGPEATIILDVGSKCTNLLVVSEDVVWQRILQIAGNEFTRTIQETFDIPWTKAEKLKRRVKKHKYADKIYKSIRPTLDRLVDEVQRSMGFFKSTHKGVRIENIMAMGGCFKLPGMVKFLEDHLNYDVKTVSSLQNFDIERALNPQLFRDNIMSFGVCLGLAVQALFPDRAIDISLLPQQFLVNKMIQRKRPYAAGIAACVGAMVLAGGLKAMARAYQLADEQFKQAIVIPAEEVVKRNQEFERQFGGKWGEIDPAANRQQEFMKPFVSRGTLLYRGTTSPEGMLRDDGIVRNLMDIASADGAVAKDDIREQKWQTFCAQLVELGGRAPKFQQALEALPEQGNAKAWALAQAGSRTAPTDQQQQMLLDGLNAALARPDVLREVAERIASGENLTVVQFKVRAAFNLLAKHPEQFDAKDVRRANRLVLDEQMAESLLPMVQRLRLFDIRTRRVNRVAWLWTLDNQMMTNGRERYGLKARNEAVFFGAEHGQYTVQIDPVQGRPGTGGGGPGPGDRQQGVSPTVEYDPGWLQQRGILGQIAKRAEGAAVPDPMMYDPGMMDPAGFEAGAQPAFGAPAADGKSPEQVGKEVLDRNNMADIPVVRVEVGGTFDATGYASNPNQAFTQFFADPIRQRWYPIFTDPQFGIENVQLVDQLQMREVFVDRETGVWTTSDAARTRAVEAARAELGAARGAGATVTEELVDARAQAKQAEMYERRRIMTFRIEFMVDPTRGVVERLEEVKANAPKTGENNPG